MDNRSKPYNKEKDSVLLNNAIPSNTVVLVNEDKTRVELPKAEALKRAEIQGVDLVLVARQRDDKGKVIYITKIMDYSKFKYDQAKKQKDSRKNQTNVKVKEIKVKPTIADNDLNVRVKRAIEWLADGMRVSFVIEARGRMASKDEIIQSVYDRFVAMIDGNGTIMQAKKKVTPTRYETMIYPLKK